MLDSHPNIFIGPESNLFVYDVPLDIPVLARKFRLPEEWLEELERRTVERAAFIREFFRRVANDACKPRWGDKTPRNVRYLGWIFSTFPEAVFLHVIRDGRDVVCSLRHHPRFRRDGTPTNVVRPLDECINRWLQDTGAAMAWRSHPRYVEVRYEHLISDPEGTMRGVLTAVDEPWHPSVLSHHQVYRDVSAFPQNPEAAKPLMTSRVGRWRQDLTKDELTHVEARIRQRLCSLGY